MPKRLLALIRKDAVLVTRNWFLFITLFVAVLFVVLINFVVPEDISLEPNVFILVEAGDAGLMEMAEDLSSRDNGHLVADRSGLEMSIREKTGSFGIVLGGTVNDPHVEFIMQGYENDKAKALLALEMNDYLGRIKSDHQVHVNYVGDQNLSKEVPFNHSVLPLFLLMEPVLLGLFFIATLMFFEKAEGTTRAYAVSPGKMFEYLLSKVIIMFLLGIASMYMVTLTTVGFGADLGAMFLIALAGSLFGSSLGLLISSFFDNLSKAMVWIVFASLLLSAPFASYYLPSFSPVWVRVMPTYSLLFALKETIYQTGQTDIVVYSMMLSACLGLLFFSGAYYRYQKSLV